MPYPESLVAPMRTELTSIGIKELKTAAESRCVHGGKERHGHDCRELSLWLRGRRPLVRA